MSKEREVKLVNMANAYDYENEAYENNSYVVNYVVIFTEVQDFASIIKTDSNQLPYTRSILNSFTSISPLCFASLRFAYLSAGVCLR
jgi:hypothetical protein